MCSVAIDITNTKTTNADNVSVGSAESPCTICLSAYEDRSVLSPCSHEYCFKCILAWSKIDTSCPLCKSNFEYIFHDFDSEGNNYKTVPVTPICRSLSSLAISNPDGSGELQPADSQNLASGIILQIFESDGTIQRIPLSQSAARIFFQDPDIIASDRRINIMNLSTTVPANENRVTANPFVEIVNHTSNRNINNRLTLPTAEDERKMRFGFPYWSIFLLCICVIVYFTTP